MPWWMQPSSTLTPGSARLFSVQPLYTTTDPNLSYCRRTLAGMHWALLWYKADTQSPSPLKPLLTLRLGMLTLEESVCQCALALRSSTHTYTVGMWPYRMIISCYKWSSKSPSMQPPVFNACSSTCKNMTIPFNTSQVKKWYLANHFSHFPSHKESLPIPISQNIQHVQLYTMDLDAIQGSIECNLV